jgi:Family of unknown function (DUF6356)
MPTLLKSMFVAHPESVGESYSQHFGVAAGFGLALIGAGLAALIHGLVPGLFEKTASTTIRRLHARIAARDGVAPSQH